MHIQVVNFHLQDLSEADYRALCDEVAPAFAEVAGLISKVWLANPSTNTYGGVYTWASREAMDEFQHQRALQGSCSQPELRGRLVDRLRRAGRSDGRDPWARGRRAPEDA